MAAYEGPFAYVRLAGSEHVVAQGTRTELEAKLVGNGPHRIVDVWGKTHVSEPSAAGDGRRAPYLNYSGWTRVPASQVFA